jgi:hypothetical protein
MRNSIAHGNVEFLPGPGGNIRALRIWNNNPNGIRTWGALITVVDMRAFLECFVRLAEQLDAERGGAKLRTG